METKLRTENIKKLFWHYTYPSLIGMFISGIYTTVDGIFVGNGVGAKALASINIAFPATMIFFAIGLMFSMGGSILISQYLGAKEKDNAESILGTSIFLLIIIGCLCPIIAVTASRQLMVLCGGKGELLDLAVSYIRIRFFFGAFEIFSASFNNFVRNDGNPNLVKKAMFIGAIMNIFLDAAFIYLFHLGISGTALATVISQGFVALILIRHFFNNYSNLKIHKKNVRWNKNYFISIIKTGITSFVMNASLALVVIFHNRYLLIYGSDIDVSAYGVVLYIYWIFLLIYNGFAQGIQPIISYNYGAKLFNRVKSTFILACSITLIVGFISLILISLNQEITISIFNNEPALLHSAKIGLNYYLVVICINGFNIISAVYFQSIGKTKIAMNLTFTRTILLVIPALLIFPLFMGINGIWLAVPFAESITAILSMILVIHNFKSNTYHISPSF